MTEYNKWSRETLKIFHARVNIVCGKKFTNVSRFLINLAVLDKFIQDMQSNYNAVKQMTIEDNHFQTLIHVFRQTNQAIEDRLLTTRRNENKESFIQKISNISKLDKAERSPTKRSNESISSGRGSRRDLLSFRNNETNQRIYEKLENEIKQSELEHRRWLEQKSFKASPIKCNLRNDTYCIP